MSSFRQDYADMHQAALPHASLSFTLCSKYQRPYVEKLRHS